MGFESMPEPTRDISGIEVTAILKRKTALTAQPSKLCVDSGTLTYKNANLFYTVTHVIFTVYFVIS